MIDEKLLREHLNSYALHMNKETYEKFTTILHNHPKRKLTSRKKNIYITVEENNYMKMDVSIKTKITDNDYRLKFLFNYDTLKDGIYLFLRYNNMCFQPCTITFTERGDEFGLTYLEYIPFMIWMSEEDKYINYFSRNDYEHIKANNKEEMSSMKKIYGEKYIDTLKSYFRATPNKKTKTVFELRVAATKMMDRFIDFMEESIL